jgi:hypothetical protein
MVHHEPQGGMPQGSVAFWRAKTSRTILAINLTFSIKRLNAMQKVLLIGNLGRDPVDRPSACRLVSTVVPDTFHDALDCADR